MTLLMMRAFDGVACASKCPPATAAAACGDDGDFRAVGADDGDAHDDIMKCPVQYRSRQFIIDATTRTTAKGRATA